VVVSGLVASVDSANAAAQVLNDTSISGYFVIPAEAGIQCRNLDSRLRENDNAPEVRDVTTHRDPKRVQFDFPNPRILR
jgi:hypothetical protein